MISSKYTSSQDTSARAFNCVNISELNSDTTSFVRNSKRCRLKMRLRMLPRSLKRCLREAIHSSKRISSFSLEGFPYWEDTCASAEPTASNISTDMTISSIFNIERDAHQLEQSSNRTQSIDTDTYDSGCSNCRSNHIKGPPVPVNVHNHSTPQIVQFKDNKSVVGKPSRFLINKERTYPSILCFESYNLPKNIPRYDFDFIRVVDKCLKEIQDVMKHFNDSSNEVPSEEGITFATSNRTAIPYGSYCVSEKVCHEFQHNETDPIRVPESKSETCAPNKNVACELNVNHAFDQLFNEFKELAEVIGKSIYKSVTESVELGYVHRPDTKTVSPEEDDSPVEYSVDTIKGQFELSNTVRDSITDTISPTTSADTFSIPTNFFKEELDESIIPTVPIPWGNILQTKITQSQLHSQLGPENVVQFNSSPIAIREGTIEVQPEIKSAPVTNNIISWMPKAKLPWKLQCQIPTENSHNYKEEFKKLEVLIQRQHELLYDEKLDTAVRKSIQKQIFENVQRKEVLQKKLATS